MIRRIRIFMLPFILLCISPVVAQGLPVGTPGAVGLSPNRLTRIGHMIQAHVDADELAGAVALVARHGQVAYYQSYGLMDIGNKVSMRKDAIFRIASMTKMMTSVCAMILYEEDLFALSDPVSKFIPEMKTFKVALPRKENDPGDVPFKTVTPDREITIRDLFRHTSGLSYGFGFNHVDSLYNATFDGLVELDLKHFPKKLSALPLAHQPGTKWEYSFSTDLLGCLIEILSGQSLDSFMRHHLFSPLNLKDTDFMVSEDKVQRFSNLYRLSEHGLVLTEAAGNSDYLQRPLFLSGGGGLVSTASDYARFLQMLLNGGHLDGIHILGRKTVELMLANHLQGIDPNWLGPGIGFGLGPAVVSDVVDYGEIGSEGLFYWAGIHNTFFFVDPKENMIGLLMTQMSPFVLKDLDTRFRKLCLQAIID